MRGWIKKHTYWMQALADLLVPRACVVCGRKLGVRERHVCIYCLSDIPGTYNWNMEHNPMADRYNYLIQRDLNEGTEPYQYAVSLFLYSYGSGYRRIPHGLKYSGDIPLGRFFADMLGKKIAGAGWFSDVDMIVPVPLHPLRRIRRGYNQSEVIASAVSECLGVPFCRNMLRRRRRTLSQTRLKVAEKAMNVSGAFSVNGREWRKSCKLRHILLVDDVFTTGATVNECRKALRTCFGPEVRISVATLAFVQQY